MNREREERLQIMLTPEELRAVDDFRYATRMPSRAAAVRELLNRGLRSLETGVASMNSRSKDFGVLEIANGSSFEKSAGDDPLKPQTRRDGLSKRVQD
jgi:hypothetical protein